MNTYAKNFGVQWHITDECNLRCKHCYRDQPTRDLSIQQNYKVFENLKRLASKLNLKMDISLTGGEAIFYPWFEELVRYLRNDEIVEEIHLMTNGTLVNKDIIRILHQYNIPGVQVSIDGTEDIHDSIRGKNTFKKSIEGIKMLIKNGIKTQVHLVFSKLNYDCVYDLIDLLDDLGVDTFLASHLVPIGSGYELSSLTISKEDWKTYQQKVVEKYPKGSIKMKILKGRPTWNLICDDYGSSCPVGINSACVLPNGDMVLCRRLPIVTGNLLRDNIFEIWYGCEDYWQFRDKSNLKGKCGSCEDIIKCGGCRALAYAFNGDYMAEDPYCWKGEEDII